jgi:2-desacetyl-2-hydroxyethyl bacteriochlorophyllide A dehydrogenase
MRAVVYAGARSVRVDDVPEPTLLEPDDALVRPSLCGICGTDLHLLAHAGSRLGPGVVLGHEFVGDVVAVGTGVRHIRPGARVFGADFTACGHCRWCDRGDHWECADRRFFGTGDVFGPALAGAQAELVRVPFADTVLLAVPDGVSDASAILLADNLPTGWAAIERSELRPGETVAIVGGGAIGQLASLCAQAAGAGVVVVVEPNAARRAFAEEHGALGVTPDEAVPTLHALTEGDGADVVVEAGGNAATLHLAPALVRRRGRIVVLGVPSAERWDFPLAESFARELSLAFAVGDAMRSRRSLLALLHAGTLDPSDLVGPSVPLGDAPAAYADLVAQRALKLVLDPRR